MASETTPDGDVDVCVAGQGAHDHDSSRVVNRPVGLLAKILTFFVVFYREAVSPLFPPSCRFEPTCSSYALEALSVHGAFRGTALSVWRILRCAPWSRGGWDPVPPARSP